MRGAGGVCATGGLLSATAGGGGVTATGGLLPTTGGAGGGVAAGGGGVSATATPGGVSGISAADVSVAVAGGLLSGTAAAGAFAATLPPDGLFAAEAGGAGEAVRSATDATRPEVLSARLMSQAASTTTMTPASTAVLT